MLKSHQRPILLVEDNENDAVLFQLALKGAELSNPVHVVCDVVSGKAYLNGESAFADREKYPFPAVLVVDVKLPDGNGLDFVRWVNSQKRFERLHQVIVTGDLRICEFHECYAAGADSFLCKPCRPTDLRNIADRYAEHWGI
jgi:CheY-like chemotaxis protein